MVHLSFRCSVKMWTTIKSIRKKKIPWPNSIKSVVNKSNDFQIINQVDLKRPGFEVWSYYRMYVGKCLDALILLQPLNQWMILQNMKHDLCQTRRRKKEKIPFQKTSDQIQFNGTSNTCLWYWKPSNCSCIEFPKKERSEIQFWTFQRFPVS